MKIRKSALSVAALCLAGSMTTASAEDRSGFLLGLAIGSSAGDVSTEAAAGSSEQSQLSASKGSAFTLKLGGSIGNKGALYLLSQGSSTGEDQAHSLFGIGGAYYFKKSGTSLYLNGGFGFGGVSYADETVSPSMGKAATIGVGLELGMGLNLEVNYLKVMTEFDGTTENPGPQVDYDIASTQFMVGYTWF